MNTQCRTPNEKERGKREEVREREKKRKRTTKKEEINSKNNKWNRLSIGRATFVANPTDILGILLENGTQAHTHEYVSNIVCAIFFVLYLNSEALKAFRIFSFSLVSSTAAAAVFVHWMASCVFLLFNSFWHFPPKKRFNTIFERENMKLCDTKNEKKKPSAASNIQFSSIFGSIFHNSIRHVFTPIY